MCVPRALTVVLLLLAAGPPAGAQTAPQPVPPSPSNESATYRLDIPAGPLETAAATLAHATGLTIDGMPLLASMPGLASRAISGVYTARSALETLLEGTPFVCRRTGTGRYSIEIAVQSERVEVAGRAGAYAPAYSSTGTRTLTPLRDIPQTLTVITRELLADQRAQSVAEAVRNVPGVSVAQGEGNRDQVVLRGISTSSDFFVNGIRDDQERFRDLYNVETLEVLQGPAAVLFGRGGAGGVVNVVTRRATPGAPSDASLEVGAYGHSRATAHFAVPAGAGRAFGLSSMAERSGGFRDGYFLRRYAVNPTFSARLGRSATLTIGGEYLHDNRLADRGIPSSAGAPVPVDPRQFFGSLQQNVSEGGVRSGNASIEGRITLRLLVRSSFLVGRYDKFYRNVYPGSAVSAAGTFTLAAYDHRNDRTNLFSQTDLVYDMRLGATQHTLLAGVEAGHQFQNEQRHTAASMANVPVASSQRDADFASAPLLVNRRAASDVLGAYVQDQVALSRRWKAVLGARLDRFGVQVQDHMPSGSDLARTDVALSPRAGLIYQPVHALSLYSSYSYTFLPSGQTLGLATNTAQLRPENATNYEAGAKLELPGGRLMLSAAAFRLRRNNARSTDPTDPTRLVLTGQQQTEGVVVSAAGSLTRAWKLHAGYANLDARITRDTTAAPAGRHVGLVPRRQASVWTTYDLTRGVGVGGGIVQQSRVFTSFTNQVQLPSFVRVDGLLYYRLGRYRLALNAENLFNEKYYPTANGDNNISPGVPRSAQISLRATF